ncbi:MAG TPA: hypothetical protein VKU19_01555 [Bryobacteraceae bacterium]|nr:hypothetical protein [Bryobacteraceae bacterium]
MQFTGLTWRAAFVGRWVALVLGSLAVLFILAFVLGEGWPYLQEMSRRERFYAAGVGCLYLGLIAAWFQEGGGGALSLAGWLILAALARRPAWDLPFSIPAALGLLHVVCWWLLRSPAPPAGEFVSSNSAATRIWLAVAAGLIAFLILLCANEIFAQPPLMSRGGRLPSSLVGTWRADLTTVSRRPLPEAIPVLLVIAPDGSVSGSIGQATLNSGHLLSNRSWFGRLMHWRTAYLIEGTLSSEVRSNGGTAGDRFTAPVDLRDAGLDGSIFLSHPAAPKPLGIRLVRP